MTVANGAAALGSDLSLSVGQFQYKLEIISGLKKLPRRPALLGLISNSALRPKLMWMGPQSRKFKLSSQGELRCHALSNRSLANNKKVIELKRYLT